MMNLKNTHECPVVCVTGAAKRIGACLIQTFHQQGYQVIIHYQYSKQHAMQLAKECNLLRPNSAVCVQANLEEMDGIYQLSQQIQQSFGRLDVLIHNASRFFPTVFGQISPIDWDDLMLSNAKAPLFLTQYLLPTLKKQQGNVISLLDIHADNKPFRGYSVYNMAKAAHRMMVQSLALELAPDVRVNGIAPGVNILPEQDSEQAIEPQQMAKICQSIPMQKIGSPTDIAQTALFLAHSPYITGQILSVDGGRSLTLGGDDGSYSNTSK